MSLNTNVKAIFSAILILGSLNTEVRAGDIKVEDLNVRTEYLKRAGAWLSPEWIDSNFTFSPHLDVLHGPATPPQDILLEANMVACRTTPEDQVFEGGANTKFYCSLLNPTDFSPILKKNGKRVKIKVKYHSVKRYNQEIFGEVLTTRLMWALGFAADKIYHVPKVLCFGCTADPYHDRQVVTSETPQEFIQTVIERKFRGDEIIFQSHLNPQRGPGEIDDTEWRPTSTGEISGWSFKESMRVFSDDPVVKYQQYTERDALRLLAVFMFHIDMKPANNRFVCLEPGDNGDCAGRTLLMINDVGSSFGTADGLGSLKKVSYKVFSTKPLWANPAKCQASLSSFVIRDKSMKNPVISEIGRKFLANLMAGFIAGPEGRKRVEDLFRAAHIDEQKNGSSVAEWTNAFMVRAEQLIYPMGRSKPDFRCPQ